MVCMPNIIVLMNSLVRPVEVLADTIHQVKVRSRSAGNGTIPTVTYTTIQVAGVKPFKVQIHFEHVLHTHEVSTTVNNNQVAIAEYILRSLVRLLTHYNQEQTRKQSTRA